MLLFLFAFFLCSAAFFVCGVMSIKTDFSEALSAYCFIASIIIFFLTILLIQELIK